MNAIVVILLLTIMTIACYGNAQLATATTNTRAVALDETLQNDISTTTTMTFADGSTSPFEKSTKYDNNNNSSRPEMADHLEMPHATATSFDGEGMRTQLESISRTNAESLQRSSHENYAKMQIKNAMVFVGEEETTTIGSEIVVDDATKQSHPQPLTTELMNSASSTSIQAGSEPKLDDVVESGTSSTSSFSGLKDVERNWQRPELDLSKSDGDANSRHPPPPPAELTTKKDLDELMFPMKTDSFDSIIIRDSNTEKQPEKPVVFWRTDSFEHRQNLILNEVEVSPPPPPPSFTFQENVRRRHRNMDVDDVSEFTGKLLAERDGIITDIEQKFQIDEYATTTSTTTTTTTRSSAPTLSSTTSMQQAVNVNHRIAENNRSRRGDGVFIDRRVKKNFEFPMHLAASDVMALPHIDFANTKFNGQPSSTAQQEPQKVSAVGAHPEFSTTKFYNSKEMYNEMLQHNMQANDRRTATTTTTTSPRPATMKVGGESAASRYAVVSSPKFSTYRLVREFSKPKTMAPQTTASSLATSTNANVKTSTENTAMRVSTIQPATLATITSATTTTSDPQSDEKAERKLLKYAKQLNRAKMLLKVLHSLNNGSIEFDTPVAISSTSETEKTVTTTLRNQMPHESIAADVDVDVDVVASSQSSVKTTTDIQPAVHSSSMSSTAATLTTSIADTSTSQTTPIQMSSAARPRIHYSRMQEKINLLECDIQGVPHEAHLWRGNETHELLLPITSPVECRNEEDNCPPVSNLSWEGEVEIQSGDILIVEINDAPLHAPNVTSNVSSWHNTQVYQVTRSGHENCDATEGILLDITPLIVDGRKLVTLYDKDLTEGTNLLIVVSELWGMQCVRLRVTTKTDNCGENAECSAKGVCFSTANMEEYECQCCNGFTGAHCEEIDACSPSPCTNNGICVDLSQGHGGHAYQCLCPYGYGGKNCQFESDPCNSSDCMNGGSCVGNSTHFSCECMPGFTGPLCQHSLNECESSPCVHGICVDQEDGFRCFCRPGFAGELCNFEYNECESNPCLNSGECIDRIGGFECRCTKGYIGARCHIKVDLCANKPCPEGRRCIDHGNDFSCDCTDGLNGPNCNQMPRTQCNVNSCSHGGTCWTSGDSFYCACRPGYTGRMCEDEFVIETVVSSSEFILDDASVRNFNERTYITTTGVLKSPIELHNAYFAAGVLAVAIFIVAIVIIICQCRSTQSYRKFSARPTSFLPILGFGLRTSQSQSKLNRHWLIGRAAAAGSLRSAAVAAKARSHLPASYVNRYAKCGGGGSKQQQQQQQQQQQNQHQQQLGDPLCERPTSMQQRHHLAMNLENDFYYTANFTESHHHQHQQQHHHHHHSQHSSLIE